MAKVSNKTSEFVSSAIISNLKPLSVRVKTLTCDNGKEFAALGMIDQQLNNTAYFARPFASWEPGSNENLKLNKALKEIKLFPSTLRIDFQLLSVAAQMLIQSRLVSVTA